MNQFKNGYVKKQISNYEIYQMLLQLINEVSDLKKKLKPIKKQKRYAMKDAAELLCISIGGLRTRIKRGQIQRITNGAKPMIAHEEIERYLRQQNPEYKENNEGLF